LQREGEFTRLLALYRDERPTRVLELGVGYGGSLFYWLRDARRDAHVTVVAVDSFHEYDNRSLFDDWVPDNVELHVIDGRTSELNTVARVYAIVPDEFDWVFIDADHSYGSSTGSTPIPSSSTTYAATRASIPRSRSGVCSTSCASGTSGSSWPISPPLKDGAALE